MIFIYIALENDKDIWCLKRWLQWRTRGSAPPPLRGCSGGHPWGGILMLNLLAFPFLRQSAFYIALHSPKLNKKRNKIYILIHNNTLKPLSDPSFAFNIHVSHFENWLFLFVVSLQKWLVHFLLQKRWRNTDFKGISEIRHLLHSSIITSYKKVF